MISRQGGDQGVVEDLTRLPQAPLRFEVRSSGDGYVSRVDALAVGRAAVRLGAGRMHLSDRVDHAVGVLLQKKVGDPVSRDEVVAEVLAGDRERGQQTVEDVRRAIVVSQRCPDVPPVVVDLIETVDEVPAESSYR